MTQSIEDEGEVYYKVKNSGNSQVDYRTKDSYGVFSVEITIESAAQGLRTWRAGSNELSLAS